MYTCRLNDLYTYQANPRIPLYTSTSTNIEHVCRMYDIIPSILFMVHSLRFSLILVVGWMCVSPASSRTYVFLYLFFGILLYSPVFYNGIIVHIFLFPFPLGTATSYHFLLHNNKGICTSFIALYIACCLVFFFNLQRTFCSRFSYHNALRRLFTCMSMLSIHIFPHVLRTLRLPIYALRSHLTAWSKFTPSQVRSRRFVCMHSNPFTLPLFLAAHRFPVAHAKYYSVPNGNTTSTSFHNQISSWPTVNDVFQVAVKRETEW